MWFIEKLSPEDQKMASGVMALGIPDSPLRLVARDDKEAEDIMQNIRRLQAVSVEDYVIRAYRRI
jgi:hypothetical protein